MRSTLDKHAADLLSLVDLTVARLLADAPLPAKIRVRAAWWSAWGRFAYGSGASNHDLAGLTRARKRLLECIFGRALAALRRAVEEDNANAIVIRQSLDARSVNALPDLAAVLLAIEAALDLLWLEQRAKRGESPLRLALCCSVFGDIAGTVTGQAQELSRLFQSVPANLQVFAVAGIGDTTTVSTVLDSVCIHLRSIGLPELVLFPGIKAPGLLGACVDGVSHGVDFIITIDGDGRLPLWEIIPAVAAMVRSRQLDAVLGSRRTSGAVVSKPGLRHLTSMINATYVNVLMGPVIGFVRDPQAIFKVYRAKRLECALKRLGYDKVNGWSLNELQDGSLACELMLLANLTDNGRRPRLLEMPALETMAYPANPERMPILAGGQTSAMIATVGRPRCAVRERPLLDEGTEVMVIRGAEGEVVKFPRLPERPAVRRLLPTSRVADKRLVHFAMSLKGAMRTIVCCLAARSHSDRGFGVCPGAIDLITDDRPEVKKLLPDNLGCECLDHAIRLPFPSAVVLRAFWGIDRCFWAAGALLEWIGMLPLVFVRIIGHVLRVARLAARLVQLVGRPAKKLLLRAVSSILRLRDLLTPLIRRCACHAVTVLELAGVLRVFAAVDRLDQRNRVFHACLRAFVRVLLECGWMLESFNVSVHLDRPVACIIQRQPMRPFWSVLEALPVSMTSEISRLLEQALGVYRSFGDAGYYDGELSLDNLGFVMGGRHVRAVLMDYGAVVDARSCQPRLLQQWLRRVRGDFAQSFQVFRLRCYARGNGETNKVVNDYISQCVGLLDQWMQASWTVDSARPTKRC